MNHTTIPNIRRNYATRGPLNRRRRKFAPGPHVIEVFLIVVSVIVIGLALLSFLP